MTTGLLDGKAVRLLKETKGTKVVVRSEVFVTEARLACPATAALCDVAREGAQ